VVATRAIGSHRNRGSIRVATGRAWFVLPLALAAAMAEATEAPPPSPLSVAPADSMAGEELPPELVEVIAELDALDQPLPQRDLLPESAPAGGGSGWGTGRLRWRTAALAGGLRQDGRFELAGDRIAGRAALRLRPDAAVDAAGGGHLRLGAWKAWAGHLTLRHGFGLVAADPARRVSLAADQGLGGVSGGLAVRTAAGEAAQGFQAGLETIGGRWRLASLWRSSADGAGAVSVRVGRSGDAGEWAVFVQRDTTGIASSWSGRLVRPSLAVQWELAGRRTGAATPNLAAVAGVSWLAAPGLRLELQSGVSGGPWPDPAAVLPTGARSGWAFRLGWRDRGQGALELLLQGARLWPDSSLPRRRTQQVVEVAWERRAGPGLTLALRARRTARAETAWSERSPWLPGEVMPAATRTVFTAVLEWDGKPARLAGQWRSFSLGTDSGGGTRQLISFAARRSLSHRWTGWAEAATAWGEPVDLVRGMTPLPGVVVARHWGRWQSEVMAGLAGAWGPVSIRLALARRLPEPGTSGSPEPEVPALEGWFEASASW